VVERINKVLAIDIPGHIYTQLQPTSIYGDHEVTENDGALLFPEHYEEQDSDLLAEFLKTENLTEFECG
jgi:hypothetical protein